MAPQTTVNSWLNVSVHAVDFFLMFGDFILNRWKFCWSHMILLVGVTILYMFWSWINWAANHFWIYPFLSWSKPWYQVLGSYVGLCVLFLLVFVLALYAHRLRDRLTQGRRKTLESIELQSQERITTIKD
ncbi:hypothetical protein K7432_004616 [Basidiobolus ranarum]|uniref:Transmembrane protein n=1 Tax=Basidiobolus ranarum TaxID=34480 RepID=A0ABR2W4C3_9FUNG